jgi:hypothetical protein
MSNNVLKLIAAALLFGAWGAVVFFGKASQPGADVFLAAIQGALVGLGVYHVGVGGPTDPKDVSNL